MIVVTAIILQLYMLTNAGYVSFLILRVCVILIVDKPTVKCSIAIKALFLYPMLCLSVMLDYFS